MRDLLSDRSVLALRSSLQLLVESVGKILDVEDRHFIILLNSSIVEELACGVKTIARQRHPWTPPGHAVAGASGRYVVVLRKSATLPFMEPPIPFVHTTAADRNVVPVGLPGPDPAKRIARNKIQSL